ncbi:DUF2493 domain-containing protein [Avrilella dinanensis]|uniref:YspA cpYpsA-related SLOG domain-containing protein n=1 Tax=Avrilella dinanensis TaxID=2008672 RepID=A0A2M9R2P9_9FLAO|nr:DUF2493 domain-containing protein [Avrilella dinanensis]PJR03140.1 hypothetical protein CDL10_00485 [Avrilella dinanensis]
MKLAIIGSRGFTDYDFLKKSVSDFLKRNSLVCTHIVSGGAKGADTLASQYAMEHQLEMIVFKPDWKQYGKRAGFIRNTTIIENADVVIAFWDGNSSGTKDAIMKAIALNKRTKIKIYKQNISV